MTPPEQVLKWNQGRLAELQDMAGGAFQTGALLAFIGFLLPWVLPAPDYGSSWWYGGWEMIFDADKREFWVIVLGILYLAQLGIGFRRTPFTTRLLVALAVFLATCLAVMLVALSVVIKNPIEAVGMGLLVLVVGHTLTLYGAITGCLLSMVSTIFYRTD